MPLKKNIKIIRCIFYQHPVIITMNDLSEKKKTKNKKKEKKKPKKSF